MGQANRLSTLGAIPGKLTTFRPSFSTPDRRTACVDRFSETAFLATF
jgi:hypothetical protein